MLAPPLQGAPAMLVRFSALCLCFFTWFISSLSAQEQALPTAPLTKLEVLPPQVELVGPRAVQRLVVLGTFANGEQRDLTRQAQFSTKNAGIATFSSGTATPIGDGRTEL